MAAVRPLAAPTPLGAWAEDAVLAAMRAWRQGCGPLEPWFRATPFAAAHHYRDRQLAIGPAGRLPPGIGRLVATLPPPEPATLWIFDLPGAVALWLALALRRRWGLASALCFNGWYDPRGVLDGRNEIPLLLGLARRLPRRPSARGTCLVFDADRQREAPGLDAGAVLDNRYALGDEDAPAVEQIRAAGWRRVRAHAWEEPAKDLVPYLEYVERGLDVTVERDLRTRAGGDPLAGAGHHG